MLHIKTQDYRQGASAIIFVQTHAHACVFACTSACARACVCSLARMRVNLCVRARVCEGGGREGVRACVRVLVRVLRARV